MRKFFFVLVLFVALFVFVACCDEDPAPDKPITFNLILDANDGSGTRKTITITGSDGKVPACPFTRDGFGFGVWNTKQDGSGTTYKKGDAIPGSDDFTLYALWGHALEESTTAWTNGNAYALNGNITIDTRVSVTGNVMLYVSEGYTLTTSEGISVPGGSTLTIDGSGTLNARTAPEDNVAAIGSDAGDTCGTISINGGNVNAIIGDYSHGAAIGGGLESSGGTITIAGGTVYAKANSTGAGIGGSDADGGNITISGGNVTAIGANGAGIGGSDYGHGGGTISISGGVITAYGSFSCAGIGGASHGAGGTITISGGTVTANGGSSGAGIGGGYCGAGGTITISGGKVTATGDSGTSGIGGGESSLDEGTLNHPGVLLQVSSDNSTWENYDDTNRMRYMRTV